MASRKKHFVEKHISHITPSTSFLDVYEDKIIFSEICVFPRGLAGMIYCNVKQQMSYQILNLNTSIAVHQMMHYAR